MPDPFNDGGYPPGAKNRSDAPYNYDPDTKVECDQCEEMARIDDAESWNGFLFCNKTCLNKFLNE